LVKKKWLEFVINDYLQNMIIIHGENTIGSREKLMEVLSQKKEMGQEIVRLEAKHLTEAELEEVLGASDLFGSNKTIVIEELHSLPTSKRKKRLIDLLNNPQTHDIVLWEKRSLTKTMLKVFNKSQERVEEFEFNVGKTIFTWLDSLGTKTNDQRKVELLHQSIESDGEYFCFLMLIRQSRLLIQIKSGSKVSGAPFMITKLRKQAENFELEELLQLHKKLLKIDLEQKTSQNGLSLIQELSLLTLSL
jgi:DNA polymerase III delta subunit